MTPDAALVLVEHLAARGIRLRPRGQTFIVASGDVDESTRRVIEKSWPKLAQAVRVHREAEELIERARRALPRR